MKILYFTLKPAPYRVEFFNQLNREHEVTVLFNYVKSDYRNSAWYKDNQYQFQHIMLKKHAFFQLRKILKKKYDVVVIGAYASSNAAIFNMLLCFKKIPFFINADGGFIAQNENFLSKYIKTFFLSKANYYLSTGKETNKYLTYYGAKSENIFIYPFTSINDKDLLKKPVKYTEKMKLRKKEGYPYQRLFVSVGSFIPRKGYDIFLEAVKDLNLKDTGFLVIGGGVEKENYLTYLKEHNMENVHFIDFCSKDKILNFYKMADVFFLPSKEDIWGLVINEAMSSGLPVISSDKVLSSLELLDKKSIYPCYDVKALQKIITIYSEKSNEELYQEGEKNIELMKNYTIENMTKVHVDIFKKALEGKNEKK